MIKLLITALVITTLSACGAQSADHSDDVGRLELAVTTATATHTYRLNGTILLYQNGTQLQSVDISADQPSVVLPDLVPGNYDVFLQGASLLKDGAPVASTMVSANPHPVTVVAGESTADNWQFSVAGDPVAFACTPQTCGSLAFTVGVTEVPPQ